MATFLPGMAPAELLITQYYEGSSNNKYVELTNTSAAPLDLTGYIITVWSNDNSGAFKTAGSFPTNEFSLSGTLGPGASYLIANPSAASPVPADQADATSTITFFNGNDSVVLYEGGTIDPANIADAVTFTAAFEGGETSFTRQNTAVGHDLVPGSSVLDFPDVWAQVETDTVDAAALGDDNFLGSSALGSVNPLVRFTSGSDLVIESDGSMELELEIRSPDGEAVSVDIVFDDANSTLSASEIGNFSTRTVTFPASAQDGDTQTISVTLTDDDEAESTETAIFNLTNLVTDGDALIGGTTSFELSVQDDDTFIAPLYISEIADPGDDFNARFVELFNPTDEAVDLGANGWTLVLYFNDNPSGRAVPLVGIIEPGGTFVIAHEADAFALAYPDAPVPDQIANTVDSNGNDNFELRFGGENGPLVDIYGSPGTDGTDQPWEFEDSQVVRSGAAPNATFTVEDWTITEAGIAGMTPGVHDGSGTGPVSEELRIIDFTFDPGEGRGVISAIGLGTKSWIVEVSDDLNQADAWTPVDGGAGEQDQEDGSTDFIFFEPAPVPGALYFRLVAEE